MKQFSKGLASLFDVSYIDMPEGYYPYGLNGLFSRSKGTVANEKGFALRMEFPGQVVGVIETPRYPVIMCKNTTTGTCYIGFANLTNNTFDVILDDSLLPFKLPFDIEWPITGEAEFNYNNELCIAFTDRKAFPMFLNCDNPNLNDLNDLNLFPRFITPGLDLSVEDGGSVETGAYYGAIKLTKEDGTSTGYIALSNVAIVQGNKDEIQDKNIRVSLTNLDTSYDYVTLCIVRKKSGIITCQELAPVSVPLSGSVAVTYTGEQLTTAITLEEVLVPRKVYEKVDDMGQLNGALYLMGLQEEEEIDMQKYANLVQVEVVSKLHNVNLPDPNHVSGKERSLTHSEVYALYISYERTSGGWTKAMHLPGLAPQGTDNDSIALPSGATGKTFMVNDTIRRFDLTSKTCAPGVWINQDETYPDHASYDSSAIGGENLRNQPVRHFRMPSVNWCKTNFYSSNASYGRETLDMLGIKVSNIIIPADMADKLTGRYRIFFARKTLSSQTVLGQSILLYGAKERNNQYVSTGGNFWSEYALRNDNPGRLNITPEVIRFHAFDMLNNKPQTAPDYLQTELKMGITNIAYTPDVYFEDVTRTGDPKNESILGYKLDYISDGNITSAQRNLINVTKRTYVPANTIIDRYNNSFLEGAAVLQCTGSSLVTPGGHVVQVHDNGTKRQFAVKNEDTFLTTAMVVRRNCYAPFTSQPLVLMGQGINTTTFYNGDTFISDYTFHTNGWWSPTNSFNNGSAQRNKQGTRTIRRFVCETAANLYARYEDLSNQYSFYYPKRTIKDQDPNNYITAFLADQEPNQFAYSKDSNALNDLVTVEIWSPSVRTDNNKPFRIHRCGFMDRVSKKRSWRTCLPLDFYELQKNMGLPQKVYGMNDRLLIVHENALFVTQDKVQLESGQLSVTLGSGDIFQFEPQPTNGTKLGRAGTQHKLACVHTPEGYIFLDAKAGNLFLWNDGIKLMNNLFDNFFEKFLRMKESNVLRGNGYTIGYDHENERILLSAKDVRLLDEEDNEVVYKNFEDTAAFYASLSVNDIVYKDGKYLKYLGVYNGSQPYDCPALVLPNCSNTSFNIVVPVDAGSIAAFINLSSYNATDIVIVSGNSDGLFELVRTTTQVVVKFVRRPDSDGTRVLTMKAINTGDTCNFTLTITYLKKKVGSLTGFTTTVQEDVVTGSTLGTVTANAITSLFSIVSPDTHPFSIVQISDTEAEIRLSGTLDYEEVKNWNLVVSADTEDGYAEADVRIDVTNVNEQPNINNVSITIFDSQAVDSVIGTLPFSDPDINQSLDLQIVSESSPGKLQVDTTNGANEIKLLETAVAGETYTMGVKVVDPEGAFKEATITVNVLVDPQYIKFRPYNVECSSVCPEGYAPTPDNSQCYKTTTVASIPPTSPGSAGLSVRRQETSYNNDGMRIYKVGEFDINGTELNGAASYTLVNDNARPFWKNNSALNGRLNGCGVWRKDSCMGTFLDTSWEYIGFSRTFNLTTAKTVYIGMAADNICRVKINGSTFIQQIGDDTSPDTGPSTGINFNYWHIYPVALSAGTHIIELLALNQGSVAIMGLEIYDNTEAEILAANSEGELDFLFSTKDMDCQPFDAGTSAGYSCADPTYSLDTSEAPPVCTKVEYTALVPGGEIATIAQVRVIDTRNDSVLATHPNDGTQRYYQGIAIPIYPEIEGSSLCGGATVLYHSAVKSVTRRKNNCTIGEGTDVVYTLPDGKWFSTVSQAAADALADTDINNNAQSYANTNGTCQ